MLLAGLLAAWATYILARRAGRRVAPLYAKQWDDLADKLQKLRETRKKLVKKKQNRMRINDKHQAMTVDAYKKRNNGRTPEQDGHSTVKLNYRGKMTDCVLVRCNRDGEFEVNMEDLDGVEVEEEVDDGSMLLREGQLEAKQVQTEMGSRTPL